MKKILMIVLAIACLFAWAVGPAFSAAPTKNDAIKMVDDGIKFYKANGKDKFFAEINNAKGLFVKGEMYVYTMDKAGHVTAHGPNKALIGKYLMELKDADGKAFVKDIYSAANKGGGWVDYKWTNPETKKIGQKTAYVKEIDGIVLICGIYK